MNTQSVRSLPLHRPVILNTHNTVKQAAYAMQSNNIGSILINSDKGRLLGILTDRDLAFAYSFKDIMTEDPLEKLVPSGKFVSVTDYATLQDVIDVMREEKIRRVPVIHEEGGRERCIGIITFDDLIKAELLAHSDEKAILKAQLDQPTDQDASKNNRTRTAFRHQDRRQHSYFNFLSKIARDTGLSRGDARNLVHYAMTVILRRITPSEGKDLLSQFPYLLQMELLPELSSTDRTFETEDIVKEIGLRLGKNTDETKALLQKFWKSLTESISQGEMDQVAAQLPKEITGVFHAQRTSLF